jgi:DNA-binding CsgD family transcriptional regulator
MSLTGRQREVVIRLCRGLTTKQIARELGVVPPVVSNHLRSIRLANGLKNVAQIGICAERAGLCDSLLPSPSPRSSPERPRT